MSNVYSTPCCIVNSSDFVFGTFMSYVPNVICHIWHMWYTCPIGGHICFWRIFTNNMWSRCFSFFFVFWHICSVMFDLYAYIACFGVRCICNLVFIFVQWYMSNMCTGTLGVDLRFLRMQSSLSCETGCLVVALVVDCWTLLVCKLVWMGNQ